MEKKCLELQLPKSSALHNQVSVWSTAWRQLSWSWWVNFLQPLSQGRHVRFCCLIHQQPSTPPVSWVQLIHLEDLAGLDVQLWAGSLRYSWTDNRRPSLVGYAVFKPLLFLFQHLCGIYHRERAYTAACLLLQKQPVLLPRCRSACEK